jgi:2,3-dihydroxybenzoate decarboxylase/5-carboxyvanillate decarboxylase
MADRLRKIAVEEAFIVPELAERLRGLSNSPTLSLDKLFFGPLYGGKLRLRERPVLEDLLDVENERLAEMDRLGVDMQVLSVTSPGVQILDADTACDVSEIINDRLSDIVRRRPDRFAGLAAFAPHAPKRAAREIERAIGRLGLNGLIVNSHTNNEYLDDPKFYPILEAAEAHDATLYIHPRAPSDLMAGALQSYGIESAMWGYGVEVGTHVVRLMASGVFDRFPKLRICIGHMGEAIPFWLWRINNINAKGQRAGLCPKTELSMQEYFLRNVYITTSGMEDPLALEYSIRKLGADRVLWAIDYPYEASASATKFIEDAPLDPEVKKKVAYKNAEALFHITPAP